METIITYRKRSVTRQDIATIRKIIGSHPDKSRRFISQEVCRQWDWRQPNGALKDMVCRSLLLLLESKGFIKLPARKFTPVNPLAKRKKPSMVIVDKTPVHCSVGDLFPIKLEQVRRTRFEKTFNALVSEYHYLGYTQPVGLRLVEPTARRESILNILHFPMIALLRAWHGVQHHGILEYEIVSLAGAKRSERTIFT